MPRLGMTIPVNHVVVLVDLPHGSVLVDPCGVGKGGDAPMHPHSDSNGISEDPRADGGGNRWSPCGFLGAVLVPAFLILRSGVPMDPRGNRRVCHVAGQV